MLTINKIFPQEKIPEKTESFLFFDIETTGFSRDNTILYLIGCGYFAEEGFQFIQWFNDDGTSEEEILLAFQNILSKKEKKFCRNYFVAVIRNSEWEGWREQWEMENKSWEKMCFFDFFINFGLS